MNTKSLKLYSLYNSLSRSSQSHQAFLSLEQSAPFAKRLSADIRLLNAVGIQARDDTLYSLIRTLEAICCAGDSDQIATNFGREAIISGSCDAH